MDKKAIINALRDYAQATSNEVANTVAGPVDLINTGLGYVGLGSKEPVGGSAWMRRQGLTAPVPEGTAQLLGETTGLVLPMVGAAKAPQIAAALRNMGENMAKPRGGGMAGGQRGAIVWHGSPYEFDWFDASKIGTGEGAQAYGYGLYLAQLAKVAQQYAHELSSKVDVNGKTLFQANKIVGTTGNPDLDDYLVANLGDLATTKRQILADIKDVRLQNPQGAKDMQKMLPNLRKSQVTSTNTGQLYKVDLPDEHIARMLDWDKPLSQQPENVRQILSNFPETKKGGGIYQQLARDLAVGEKPIFRFSKEGQKEAAEYLREAGIPGIRYLDGGSRNAGGSGTSNFVVFPGNEGILKILERNGAPVSTQNLVKALRNGN